MHDILFEKNKHYFVDYFNINPKMFRTRRFLMAFMLSALVVMVSLLLNQLIFMVMIPFMAFMGYKIPYIGLMMRKDKDDIIKGFLFPNFLRYFISLIDSQGNVYQTLRASIEYVNEPLKDRVQELVDNLDDPDIDSHEAFAKFANYIGSSEAVLIMNMIRSFHDDGISKEDIQELEVFITSLQENKTNEMIRYKVRKTEIHANPPILYALIYILGFTFTVMFYNLQIMSF